jgi:hypothetical protein
MVQENVEARNVVALDLSNPASSLSEVDTAAPKPPGNAINDSQFITELNRLRNLKGFLNNEAVVLGLSDVDSNVLGDLFTLTESYRGRSPTGAEWTKLDQFNQLFFQRLTEAQRRRFLLGGIPQGFAKAPIIFAGVALLSLLGTVLIGELVRNQDIQILIILSCYLFWLISLGAIGSIAFIGMNALSVQQDITFDLLNPRLINLRIALGALFALVLTLPFGFTGYVKFIRGIVTVTQFNGPSAPDAVTTSDALMLIMPFLLGFSTSLVIMILNRMLEAAQSFFGKTLITTAPTAPASTVAAMPATSGSGTGSAYRKRRLSPSNIASNSATLRQSEEASEPVY